MNFYWFNPPILDLM